MDDNLLHISYESGVLEDPMTPPPKDMFRLTRDLEDTPNHPSEVEIEFQKGVPVRVSVVSSPPNEDSDLVLLEASDPIEIFKLLNEEAGKHGVGRIRHRGEQIHWHEKQVFLSINYSIWVFISWKIEGCTKLQLELF